MKNHTDKFLLGFLGFGILLYLLSMGFGKDPSSDFSGNSSKADPETPIVRPLVDTMETASDTSIVRPLADTMAVLDYEEESSADFSRNPSDTDTDTSIVSPLADTMAVLQRKISLKSYTLNEETATHWKLSSHLEEISGLAMTRDNRLLAHNDERGVIFEIDYQNGSIAKSFQMIGHEEPGCQ